MFSKFILHLFFKIGVKNNLFFKNYFILFFFKFRYKFLFLGLFLKLKQGPRIDWTDPDPGKANIVGYALSRKLLYISALMIKETNLIEQLRDLSLVCELKLKGMKLGMSKVTNKVLERIKGGQKLDLHLLDQLTLISQRKEVDFNVGDDDIIRFQD